MKTEKEGTWQRRKKCSKEEYYKGRTEKKEEGRKEGRRKGREKERKEERKRKGLEEMDKE